MNYKISEDVKFIREMLSLSQDQLASEIDVNKLTILRIENEETWPSDETTEKLYCYIYRKGIKINRIKEMFYKEEILNKKLVFHGAKEKINDEISPFYGREHNDFGRGFYCGESMEQSTSFVSRYKDSSLYILSFDDKNLKKAEYQVDQEWMLTIAYFRGTIEKYKDHPLIKKLIKKVTNADYIYAPIADNRMFMIIDQFIDGLITDEQCKHCLAATNLGNQYVFLSEKATSQLEILERCYICELERKDYQKIKEREVDDSDNKVRAALIKYKNKGRYIGEILDEVDR